MAAELTTEALPKFPQLLILCTMSALRFPNSSLAVKPFDRNFAKVLLHFALCHPYVLPSTLIVELSIKGLPNSQPKVWWTLMLHTCFVKPKVLDCWTTDRRSTKGQLNVFGCQRLPKSNWSINHFYILFDSSIFKTSNNCLLLTLETSKHCLT